MKHCAINDCPTPARSRGYCDRHYHNVWRWGDPHGKPEPWPPPGAIRITTEAELLAAMQAPEPFYAAPTKGTLT